MSVQVLSVDFDYSLQHIALIKRRFVLLNDLAGILLVAVQSKIQS